jgi:hypothetical protein
MVEEHLIREALAGVRGEDQQRIALEGLKWTALLLRKNADYGGSVWKPPILAPDCSASTAIRVRMSDKIERISNLLSKSSDPEIVTESLDDTLRDLGAYCLLELCRPDR